VLRLSQGRGTKNWTRNTRKCKLYQKLKGRKPGRKEKYGGGTASKVRGKKERGVSEKLKNLEKMEA